MIHTRLLIVHPDASARAMLTSMLQAMGHKVDEALNDRAAIRMLQEAPADLVMAGIGDEDAETFEFLTCLRRKYPLMPVVLLASDLAFERSREALRQRGASSVLRYPLPASNLRAAVMQALGRQESAHPVPDRPFGSAVGAAVGGAVGLRAGEPVPFGNGHGKSHGDGASVASLSPYWPGSAAAPTKLAGVVGEDPVLRHAMEITTSIASTRAPVLIVGERGTGKTLLARLLHSRSPRRDGPFHEVDCSAMGEEALGVELLGRGEPGRAERPGKFDLTHGGTLFLDDIGSLPAPLQFTLLRLLEDGHFEPIGATQPVRTDLRLVVSSREGLDTAVDEGRFRPDLALRLGVVTLTLPPLRQRGTDIDRLADHFLVRFSHELGKRIEGFTSDALGILRRHPWPGNIPELQHVVERAVVLCRGPRVTPAHLELIRHDNRPDRPSTGLKRTTISSGIIPLKEALEGPERRIILEALQALNWNRQETARVLDINRTTLYKKMKKYGLLYEEVAAVN